MKTTRTLKLLLLSLILGSSAVLAQTAKETAKETANQKGMERKTMNTYVIEREIPDAGNLNAEALRGISQTSCRVLKELGPKIEWVHSYVTGNRIFCIYRAENEDILKKHAEKGGFPINSVHKVSTVISPATATASLAEIIR